MEVTLIRPSYFSVWESLACGYIGSYMKKFYRKEPLELQYFDGFFEDDGKIVSGCLESDYVGFSCTSPQMKHALSLAERIKQVNPKVITVFGGHHPSSLPHETLQYPQVDMVVAGEGETGMLSALEDSSRRLIQPQPIQNLDALPFPDRHLIHQERTIAITEKNDGKRIASVLSGRSCPFHCIFCTGDHDVFGLKVRKRSPDNVLDEVEQLIRDWRIDFLKFADAEINTATSWVKSFCRQKISRGLGIPWGANIHAAIIDFPTLEYMANANCQEIWVGVESGSPRILKEMRKGVTVQQIENVFRWAKELGIHRRAYFMCGFNGETRRDFEMTLELAEKLDADVVGMTIPCPYPGTELYSEQFKNVDWSMADEYGNDFWRTEEFSSSQLKALQAEFTGKFKDRLCWRQKKG